MNEQQVQTVRRFTVPVTLRRLAVCASLLGAVSCGGEPTQINCTDVGCSSGLAVRLSAIPTGGVRGRGHHCGSAGSAVFAFL